MHACTLRTTLPIVGSLLAAALTLACGGDKSPEGTTDSADTGVIVDNIDIIAYDLSVQIVLPLNQSNLFDEVARLDLVIEQVGSEVGRWSMEDIARGALDRTEGLPALDGAVLGLEGFNAEGLLVAYGASAPVTIRDGEGEVSIMVGRSNAFGWLYNLSSGSAAAAMAADHTGGVLFFGGTDRAISATGVRAGAVNSVSRLDLGRPEEGLVFTTVGSMVPFDSTEEDPGRAGHTATRLGGTHDNRDLILVAGGSTDFYDTSQVTDQAFLWDPSTDTPHEGGVFTMGSSMRHHVAVADAAGNVVLSGGTHQDSANNVYAPQNSFEFFDGASLEFTTISPPSSDSAWIHHAAATFGERGTLICGGLIFPGVSSDYNSVAACGLVSTSGSYQSQDECGISLPTGLTHHAMVGLADGGVLVTGGATYEGGRYNVTNEAWVLSADGSTWTSVGPMHLPRALHSMTRLPDGRVVVVGGATKIETHWWSGEAAIACAEVFNPELGDFVELTTCNADDVDGALPEGVVMPSIVTEPTRGIAVVAGGLNRDEDGATGAAVYLPPPTN